MTNKKFRLIADPEEVQDLPRPKFVDMSLEQLEKERQQRLDMLPQLVGWLYPSILSDELAEIENLIENLINEEKMKIKPQPTPMPSNGRSIW